MTASSAPNYAGQVFEDRYRILKLIGEGGMGAVYEAEHIVVGRKVAIKLLHPDMARDHNVVARFYNEARAAGSIGNEHIVEVLDFGKQPAPYLVMELLAGRSLSALLETERTLSPTRAATVLMQVLEALRAAHAKDIVHRDLKPENIFVVDKDGRESIKLVDFGISKLKNADSITGGHLTQTGTVLGTPYYMSPEQALGARDLDHLTDIYSAGVILYECVTGQQPYSAENYNMLLVKIISESAVPPRTIRPDLPEALEHIIQKAMAQDRPQRFRTAGEFADALRAFVEGRRTGVLPVAAAASDTAARIAAARSRILQGTAPGGPPGSGTDLAWAGEPGTLSPAASKNRGIAIGIGATIAVAVLAVGMWFAFLRGGGEEGSGAPAAPAVPTVAVGPAAAPQSPPTPPPAQAVPVTESEPAAEAVQLKVVAVPTEAKIYLDDVELPGNPVSARFRKDGVMHRLRVVAAGFAEQTRFVEFSGDVEESFTLEPPAAPDAPDAGNATVAVPDVVAPVRPTHPAVVPRERDAGRIVVVSGTDAGVSAAPADTGVGSPGATDAGTRTTVGPRELDLPVGARRDVPRLEENPYGTNP